MSGRAPSGPSSLFPIYLLFSILQFSAHGGTSFLELSGARGGVVAGGAVQRRVCRERGVGSSTSNLLLCSGFCSSELDDLGCRSVVDLFHRLFLGFVTSEDKVSIYGSVLWVDLLQLCSVMWRHPSCLRCCFNSGVSGGDWMVRLCGVFLHFLIERPLAGLIHVSSPVWLLAPQNCGLLACGI